MLLVGGEDQRKREEGKKRVQLKCTHCKETFVGAWDLMFHVQNAHSLNIYTLGENRPVKKSRFCKNNAKKVTKSRINKKELFIRLSASLKVAKIR
jgi:hypothetical protein